jgi:hypothetical protein
MGFPDTFRIPVSDTQAYKQFGNSIVVPVVAAVARQMEPHLGLPAAARSADELLLADPGHGVVLERGAVDTPGRWYDTLWGSVAAANSESRK